MSKNKVIYLAISLVLSLVLMALLIAQIDFRDLMETLKRVYTPALLLYMGIALVGALLRAWRYKMFLRPASIGWGSLVMATFVRNSFVDLLPARLGSLSFIYVLNKRLGLAFEAAASAFVASFIFDFLTLGPFVVLAILTAGLGSSLLRPVPLFVVSGLFFLAWLIILRKSVELGKVFLRLYLRLLIRFRLDGKRWAEASAIKIEETLNVLSGLRARKRDLPYFCLSLLIRLAKYASIYFLLFAILRSHGFGLDELSFWKLILGLTGAELTSAFPIKGLAGFGTWETAWALTMGLMGFDKRFAILSGLGVHLLTNIFEYSLGIASLAILALPFIKASNSAPPPSQS